MELDTFLKKGLWAFACSEDPSLGVGAFQLSFVEAAEGRLALLKEKRKESSSSPHFLWGLLAAEAQARGTSDLKCAPRSWLLRC